MLEGLCTPAVPQCACAVGGGVGGDCHELGQPLGVDDEVSVHHVFGVLVEDGLGAVDILVPVIPVGRGRLPVGL